MARWVETRAGHFRVLDWPGAEPPALLLHGLSGVADVWAPTVRAVGPDRPRCVALDQRGHGQSPKPLTGYGVGNLVRDTVEVMAELGIGRFHLVGHSMGGRVAMVLAARRPRLVHSTAIVDIGPEAWKANWQETVGAFERMPRSFADRDELEAFGLRPRAWYAADPAEGGGPPSEAPTPDEARRVLLARVEPGPRGSYRWRADIEALKAIVRNHRSRHYWRDWERLPGPAMLVRGGRSNELRPRVADEMRRRNPLVRFVELEGVGHNIPLLAPGRLADVLREFWVVPGLA